MQQRGAAINQLWIVRFAINPCGLGWIEWVYIPNNSKSFIFFLTPSNFHVIGITEQGLIW